MLPNLRRTGNELVRRWCFNICCWYPFLECDAALIFGRPLVAGVFTPRGNQAPQFLE